MGSRGDVQHLVASGKVLKETYGHRVRLATHLNFKDFVQENGLEFFSIGGDPLPTNGLHGQESRPDSGLSQST